MNLHRHLIGLLFASLLCTLTGCGGGDEIPRHSLTGSVSVGGVPLESGVIRFIPVSGSQAPATQAAIDQGRYAVPEEEGLPAGAYRVEIEANHLGFPLDDEKAFVEQIEQQRGGVLPPNPIDPRYNRNSELQIEVATGDEQTFDFDLEPAKT